MSWRGYKDITQKGYLLFYGVNHFHIISVRIKQKLVSSILACQPFKCFANATGIK